MLAHSKFVVKKNIILDTNRNSLTKNLLPLDKLMKITFNKE